MTDLLTRARTTGRPNREATGPVRRPLALGALGAGAAASVSMLLACMALGLAGWFDADAGAYGTTKDAIRIGADGWLLAHGSALELPGARLALVPLGLTLLCTYVCLRLGRWAGATSQVEDDKTLLLGAVVLAGVYAVVALVTAVLATATAAQPQLLAAFVGGFAVAFVGGGTGLLLGSGRARPLLERIPAPGLAVLRAAAAGLLLMVAVSGVLVTTRLLLHLGGAANVLSLLHVDTGGGILATVVVAAVSPNAVLLGGSYLLGPGFAVGAGTTVSPGAVVIGPLPAFPLFAALPQPGPTPWWTILFLLVPVLAAGLAVFLVARHSPVEEYVAGAVRGLGGGAGAGLGFGALVCVAGGSVGPGRMADLGAPAWDVLGAALLAMAVGGLLSGLASTWWARRHWFEEAADEEPTVRLEG